MTGVPRDRLDQSALSKNWRSRCVRRGKSFPLSLCTLFPLSCLQAVSARQSISIILHEYHVSHLLYSANANYCEEIVTLSEIVLETITGIRFFIPDDVRFVCFSLSYDR